LKDIHSSDEIVLQTPKRVLRYAVDWVKVVDPADVSVLETTGDTSTLTLVTCYPFYLVGPAPRRYVVHAHIRQ
jgi:sortase A